MADFQLKNAPPLVSVIIPTYNGEEFLQQAVDSVFAQTFQNFELVITDDDSTDGTQKIVSLYQDDSRVSFYQNKKRLGIGGNWNYGVKQARGKYVKILCQDDVLNPTYLDEVVDVLETDLSISLVTTFEQFLGESNRVRDEHYIPYLYRVGGNKILESILKKGNWIGGPTAVTFRREQLAIGMFDTTLECGLDYEMWLRLLHEGDLYVIPKILYHSRIHKGQATTTCKRNLGFDKDRIRILNKIKKKPQIYGEVDSAVFRKAMEQAIRMYVHRSIKKRNELRVSSAWLFLKQNIGFLKSVKSLIRGALLLSINRFRKAIIL